MVTVRYRASGGLKSLSCASALSLDVRGGKVEAAGIRGMVREAALFAVAQRDSICGWDA